MPGTGRPSTAPESCGQRYRQAGIPERDRGAEATRRGRLHLEADADCVHPIGVRRKNDIATLVTGLPGRSTATPVRNLELATLRGLGVARVSYGPRFYRAAMADPETTVQKLLGSGGAGRP